MHEPIFPHRDASSTSPATPSSDVTAPPATSAPVSDSTPTSAFTTESPKTFGVLEGCNRICAECPAHFRCQDAFAHPGPGLCNLSALLEDLAGCLNDLATDAGARAETTNLVYELRMGAQIVTRMRYCIDVLGIEGWWLKDDN